MANPQHIEWLLEGVEAWNARRIADTFAPDFEGFNPVGELRKRGNPPGVSFIFRGGNFRAATFQGADVIFADFTGADLRRCRFTGSNLSHATLAGTNLQHANLTKARLVGTTFDDAFLLETTLHQAYVGADFSGKVTDLRAAQLTQMQLDSTTSDGTTLLPSRLSRPAHWPSHAHGMREGSRSPTGAAPPDRAQPFVFLSYARRDTALAQTLHNLLCAAEVPVWWDRNIAAGEDWRDTIAARLQDATIVLTLWTEASAASRSVREEAGFAQDHDKLMHARCDGTRPPWGFGETQLTDLSAWDGDSEHPDLQTLLKAVADRCGAASPGVASKS